MVSHPYPHKLSLCLIASNEAENVKEFLDSFYPIADEIIVNVNNCTDNTLEELGKYKGDIRIIQSKWQNDFSKARNLTLKYASYGLIMFADFDDRLPPESVPLINKIKERDLDSFYYFRVINTVNGLPNGSNFLQCRMFPNSDRIFFVNPVHESISQSCVKAGLTAYNVNNIKIHHTGYESSEAKAGKAKRNIALIKSISNYSFNHYWLKSLGACYEMTNDFQSAFDYYFSAMTIEKNANIYKQLGNAKLFLKDYSEAENYFKLGLDIEPEHMELNYHLAKVYEFTSRFIQAIQQYEKVLKLPEQISTVVNQYHQCRIYTFHFLLRIYTAFEMNQKAVELVEMMHICYPKHRVNDD